MTKRSINRKSTPKSKKQKAQTLNNQPRQEQKFNDYIYGNVNSTLNNQLTPIQLPNSSNTQGLAPTQYLNIIQEGTDYYQRIGRNIV